MRHGISELAEQLDVLVTSTAPNGNTSARKGRVALYDTGSGFEFWINTNGLSAWKQLASLSDALWEIDGTETQLVTADEIDMQSKKIINLLDPISNQHAATKKYVDDNVAIADEKIKGWINFNGTGTIAIRDSFNVSSITDNGSGNYTITWDTDFANTNYAVVATGESHFHIRKLNVLVGSVDIITANNSHVAANDASINVIAIGDQ